jgi:hypothetical protein
MSKSNPVKITRTKVALWLIIAPTALLATTFILYALVNLLAQPIGSTDTLFTQPANWQVIANVILYVAGVISVVTWLPGLIVGIVLLVTKK